jgi:hypothetical protein
MRLMKKVTEPWVTVRQLATLLPLIACCWIMQAPVWAQSSESSATGTAQRSTTPANLSNGNALAYAPETHFSHFDPRKYAAQKPLMIIRFNKEYVGYDAMMTRVFSQVKSMPQVRRMTIVGYIPDAGTTSFTQKSQVFLSEHVRYTRELALQQGIKSSIVDMRLLIGSSSGYNEIRIYLE